MLSAIFNAFKNFFVIKSIPQRDGDLPVKKYYSPVIDSHTVWDCKRYSCNLDAEIDKALFKKERKIKDG